MESQHNSETSAPQSNLCKCCNQFYGHASTNYMCSCCYKKFVAQNSAPKASPPVVITPVPEPEPTPQKEEVKATPVNKFKQQCDKCGARVGYMGYPCKCGHLYCAKHRHPDEHSCAYDFKQEARQKLAKANPIVANPKLEQL